MNEKLYCQRVARGEQYLVGVPLMFRGGLQFQIYASEYWVLRKVPEPGGWEIKQFLG